MQMHASAACMIVNKFELLQYLFVFNVLRHVWQSPSSGNITGGFDIFASLQSNRVVDERRDRRR